jgi:hypothetical protein
MPTGGLTIGRVHLRRALLLFALVLGLTALATAVAPPRQSADDNTGAPPPPAHAVPPATTVSIPAPPTRKPLQRRLAADAHVVVNVVAAEGGQATIPKLGRTASAAPGDPASFDLLGLSPGRYDVLFQPALGEPVRVGTLVSPR